MYFEKKPFSLFHFVVKARTRSILHARAISNTQLLQKRIT
ncbi:hypothetical protein HMPREF3232_00692 [Fannyhessea vaginae]|nr:hypothetical protein HMPREF3232_00692 [Fannyhessea vaginae]